MATWVSALVGLMAVVTVHQLPPARQTIHPDAPPQTRQFEFMLGDWRGEITSRNDDGSTTHAEIFWEGRYILDGWAIRTDWRIPLAAGGANHGTMIRAFDRSADQWRVSEVYTPGLQLHTFTARMTGTEMVQLGEGTRGGQAVRTRRTFFNITPDVYENRYETSSDGGRTWTERSRSLVRRIAKAAPP